MWKYVPNNIERVTVEVPALNNIFPVLKDNLHKGSVISLQDRCDREYWCICGLVRYASRLIDAIDLEVIR